MELYLAYDGCQFPVNSRVEECRRYVDAHYLHSLHFIVLRQISYVEKEKDLIKAQILVSKTILRNIIDEI